MSEGGIVIEDPRWAHIPRPSATEVWWLVERAEEHLRGCTNIVAVLSRTWFLARAAGRVLLQTERVDGDVAGEATLRRLDGKPVVRGPQDLFFCAIDFPLTTDFSETDQRTTCAFATRDGVREVACEPEANATEQTDTLMHSGAEQSTPTLENET